MAISIKFFKKHIMRSDEVNKRQLNEPEKNFSYFRDLLVCKLKYIYLLIFYKYKLDI